MESFNPEARIAVLGRMVSKAPNRSLGRTQVMKLFYFLQELKGVPLGYDFRLFNYGPFDSEVLSDLSSGCGLEAVHEEVVIHANGYGYAITPGQQAGLLEKELDAMGSTLKSIVDQVVLEFGKSSASELELLSTILYVDREFAAADVPAGDKEITDRVQKIKPHFSTTVIRQGVLNMAAKGHLKNVPSHSV